MSTPGITDGFCNQDPDFIRLRNFIVNSLINEDRLNQADKPGTHNSIEERVARQIANLKLNLTEQVLRQVVREVTNEFAGYGPIQQYLEDPDISEVMVNGPDLVFVEKNGDLIETDTCFDDEAHLMRVINRMIHPIGRQVSYDNPNVDARLPDGSRVNVVIPPVAVDGPYLTIRKFLASKMTLADLIALNSMTEHMGEFLQACISARLNILITGGTSSGKTTMLNILSRLIPGQERIVTIEDAVELKLHQRHVVRMETKPPNVDGTGEVTTRELVRNALRMRPDRIVVGEVRGGESLDMLQALNTGHSGSLTTLHANSPRDAISRLETMAMMTGLEIPFIALRRQIASAIQLIVHQTRLQDGTRKTTRITEVCGMETDIVSLTDIFKFEQTGIGPDGKIKGEMRPTGIRPLFTPRLEVVGYKLRGEIFGAGTPTRY
jgi:pilus assembly protein CpaF